MNIVRENLDNLTSLLKVTVSEADYKDAVEKTLREYRRKANIPGFRPGMVPMGLINKMYRKGAIAEEAYRTASQACFEYIDKEKINYVGDLLPSESQQALDFDNQTEHEFIFEFGAAPEVKIALSAKDKVTKYTINIDDKMREGYRENFMRRFGKLEDVEVVSKDEALDVTLEQEGGLQIEEAYVGLISMSEEDRKPFIGKKLGDTMEVNINDLYKTPSQRASILGVKPEELEGINPEFKLTITKIRQFVVPALDDEFFKLAFPDGAVTDEKGYNEFIDTQIARDLSGQTEQMFTMDMHNFLMEKGADLAMPEAFMKRWLYTINEGKFSMEEIEKDFDKFVEMMKWNMIQQHYIKELNLEVNEAEILNEAKAYAMMQFAQYGLNQVADDMLENYAKSILGNKEESRKLYDRLFEQKVIAGIAPQITVTEKAVSAEEFGKLVEKLQK